MHHDNDRAANDEQSEPERLEVSLEMSEDEERILASWTSQIDLTPQRVMEVMTTELVWNILYREKEGFSPFNGDNAAFAVWLRETMNRALSKLPAVNPEEIPFHVRETMNLVTTRILHQIVKDADAEDEETDE